MTTHTTQAPRPAAVDLTLERAFWAEAPRVMAILADLRATRRERDAALAAVKDWRDLFALVEDERDELRKAAAADPVTVPDVPGFLAHRVNGGAS